MSKVWDEIKNLPDLKPYVYGLKKEYDTKIKELEKQRDLNPFLIGILEVIVKHLDGGGIIYPDSLAHEELKDIINLALKEAE